ncbi:MAG TPA: hypothetical protein VFO60_02780, partial [Candidatus Dormibacteraeota bacterium]|nr:hypothetical protein [Candidatus Dormibacteraeota bacterium]
TYLSDDAVPVGGAWKTVVGLERGDQLMAAPVALPLESSVEAPPILPVPVRHATFVQNTFLTQRETHDGPGEISLLGWGSLLTWLSVWVGLMVLAAWRLSTGAEPAGDNPRPAPRPAREWWMPAEVHQPPPMPTR